MKDEEASGPLVFHSSSAKSPFTTKRKSLPPLFISKLVPHCRKTHSAQVKHSWGRRTWLHSCSFLPALNTHSGGLFTTEQKLSLHNGVSTVE